MNDEINLLVTLYQHTEGFGENLLRCAIKIRLKPDEQFDREYLEENRELIKAHLPAHVASAGPIVQVEQIFEVVA